MTGLRIGEAEIKNKIFLAPMAGITDLPFRLICRNMGAGLAYTEMVSAKGLYYDNDRTSDIMQLHEKEKPSAVQIFGSDPAIMAEVAEKISMMDGVLLIDINMGCPAPKIVKNGEGSALMRKPALAGEIVKAVSGASKVPVTVKMRKGWDEQSINVLEVAEICEKNGAKAITVHGRTREQMYSGKADWDIIKKVKENSSVVVIGNGDIFEPNDAKYMMEYTNCDAVMIGRGAQGNPWIFKRAIDYMETGILSDAPTPKDKISMALQHLDMMVSFKGEIAGVKESRKHMAAYLKGLKNAAEVKQRINTESSSSKVKEILVEYMNYFIMSI